MTGRTFFDKVWDDHVICGLDGGASLLQIDRLLLHELSGGVALRRLEASGRKPASAGQTYSVIDHLISSRPGRGPEDTGARGGADLIRSHRRLSRDYGFTFLDVGDARQGIVHVVSPELGIALPGLSIVCGDSHTCTLGGVGALSWGIGSTECEHVLATQTLSQIKPRNMRVRFEADLPAGVYPKDMILHLIGTIGASGGLGYAVEFAGSTIRGLPVEGRLTICNMAIEFSAKYGFVPPDEITFAYLKDRDFSPKGAVWEAAVSYWKSLASDPDASFDHEIVVDSSAISPQVTWGTSPQHVLSIDDRVPDPLQGGDDAARRAAERALSYIRLAPGTPIRGVPVDAAYIGSCTNARLSDLRAAAAVLKGRRVASGVQAICVPGSTKVRAAAEEEGLDQIFKAAGFEWHESGCAMCSSGGADRLADRRVISTTNRNFEGRQGPSTRTHLASPATVAASAVTGSIADARDLMA